MSPVEYPLHIFQQIFSMFINHFSMTQCSGGFKILKRGLNSERSHLYLSEGDTAFRMDKFFESICNHLSHHEEAFIGKSHQRGRIHFKTDEYII